MSFEECRVLLKNIILEKKNGYMVAIKHQYPFLISLILKATSFADAPWRSFATRVWYVTNDIHCYLKCKTCGKDITKNIYRRTDPRMDFCSLKCACNDQQKLISMQKTSLKHYGTMHPMKSMKILRKAMSTNLKNFGTRWPQQSKEVKRKSLVSFKRHCKEDQTFLKQVTSKIQATSLKNNGYKTFFNSEEGKAAIQRSHSTSARKKSASTKKKNYYLKSICSDKLVIPLFSIDEYAANHKASFAWRCKKCGSIFQSKTCSFRTEEGDVSHARCLKCYPLRTASSLEERNLKDWLQRSFGNQVDVIWNQNLNYTLIYPYQIDILLVDKKTKKLKVAVEFNGSKWHSVENGSAVDRHLQKTKLCECKGISLIHVYEDEWLDKAKRRSLKKHLKLFLRNKKLSCFHKQMLCLSRDKFPKTLKISGYKLVSESKPSLNKRLSLSGKTFNVPDCGMLTYKKTSKNAR